MGGGGGVPKGVTGMAEKSAAATDKRVFLVVVDDTPEMPVLYIRQGSRRDELLKLLAEEPSISILVLAASAGPGGPGPLISALTGKYNKQLRIPLTIVPGTLSEQEIDALA